MAAAPSNTARLDIVMRESFFLKEGVLGAGPGSGSWRRGLGERPGPNGKLSRDGLAGSKGPNS
jgi:hypothetical protein